MIYEWQVDTWKDVQHLYSSEKCKLKPKGEKKLSQTLE